MRWALIALVLATAVTAARGQAFSVTDFRDTTGLVTVNIPKSSRGAALELTASGRHLPTRGAVWHRDRVPLDGTWSTTIAFQILDTGGFPDPSGRAGADGLAIVLQQEGLGALGGTGFHLGYGGIKGGLAIELDTWDDSDEPIWGEAEEDRADHVAIHSNPGMEYLSAVPQYSKLHVSRPLPFEIADGFEHTLTVRYSPGRLRVYVDDCSTPVLQRDIWLEDWMRTSEAWIGITASTQAAFQRHRILSWCFSATGIGCGCAPKCDTIMVPSAPEIVERVRVDTVYVERIVQRRDTVYVASPAGAIERPARIGAIDTTSRIDSTIGMFPRLDADRDVSFSLNGSSMLLDDVIDHRAYSFGRAPTGARARRMLRWESRLATPYQSMLP